MNVQGFSDCFSQSVCPSACLSNSLCLSLMMSISSNARHYHLYWFQRQTLHRCQVLALCPGFAQLLTIIDLDCCADYLLCCVEGVLTP